MSAVRSATRYRPVHVRTGAARRAAARAAAGPLLLALTLALPGAARAADGDPDPGFGTAGRVLTGLAATEDVQDLVVRRDGRIITAGTRWPGGADGDGDFAVVRYRADGSPDPGFGSGGAAVTDLGGDDVADGAALQRDGKLLVVGRSTRPGHGCCRFAMVRLLADGRPDPRFGNGGTVLTGFEGVAGGGSGGGSASAEAHAVAVQPDGLIVVAGRSGGRFALARYRPDGRLDPDFGRGGRVVTDFPGGGAHAYDLAVQPDGRIVVAGQSGFTAPAFAADFALARYRRDGTLDPDFGTGGRVVTDAGGEDGARGIALQADGRIVAAGYSTAGFALARYLADGRPDPDFGEGGPVVAAPGADGEPARQVARAYDVAVRADGRIVAAGLGGGAFAVARYRADGSPDPAFGTGGRVATRFGPGRYAEARAVAVQPDGAVVAAGIAGTDRALVRYLSAPGERGLSAAPESGGSDSSRPESGGSADSDRAMSRSSGTSGTSGPVASGTPGGSRPTRRSDPGSGPRPPGVSGRSAPGAFGARRASGASSGSDGSAESDSGAPSGSGSASGSDSGSGSGMSGGSGGSGVPEASGGPGTVAARRSPAGPRPPAAGGGSRAGTRLAFSSPLRAPGQAPGAVSGPLPALPATGVPAPAPPPVATPAPPTDTTPPPAPAARTGGSAGTGTGFGSDAGSGWGQSAGSGPHADSGADEASGIGQSTGTAAAPIPGHGPGGGARAVPAPNSDFDPGPVAHGVGEPAPS